MEIEIKKGNHYCNKWFPSFTFKSKISGSFKFIGNFYYDIEKQEDTNKLVGLSDSLFGHHRDSIRIGWRYFKDNIELMAVIYRKGKRTIVKLSETTTEKTNTYLIDANRDSYVVIVNGQYWFFDRTSHYNFLRYKLKPYFGGTTKAPKNFKFEIV